MKAREDGDKKAQKKYKKVCSTNGGGEAPRPLPQTDPDDADVDVDIN